MRPDELANQSQIELENRFASRGRKGIAALSSLGTAVGGAPFADKVMPFLNKYIPYDLALKGINKVSPKLGEFLKRGQEQGLNVEDGLNFIKENLGSKQTESAKQNKNIIEQESPELHQFMLDHIKQGRNAYQAGSIASKDKRFANVIQKLSKQHKLPWADIIDQIYGEALPKGKPTMMQQESDRFNQQYGDQGQQQTPQMQPEQAGQGLDPGVAAILQQGAAILQQAKGRM